LSTLITTGTDAHTALDIVEKLLKNIMHINSFGLNAKNYPYSHNNINGNNVIIAEEGEGEKKERVLKVINFSSAVACENVERGTPVNNEPLYTPPEFIVFED